MTDEEINVAIAEACGWRNVRELDDIYPDGSVAAGIWRQGADPADSQERAIPDYCNDLNAMHEAEKVLSAAQRYANLRNLSQDWRSWNDGTAYLAICYATARQRAEAFLRTIGKWKE